MNPMRRKALPRKPTPPRTMIRQGPKKSPMTHLSKASQTASRRTISRRRISLPLTQLKANEPKTGKRDRQRNFAHPSAARAMESPMVPRKRKIPRRKSLPTRRLKKVQPKNQKKITQRNPARLSPAKVRTILRLTRMRKIRVPATNLLPKNPRKRKIPARTSGKKINPHQETNPGNAPGEYYRTPHPHSIYLLSYPTSVSRKSATGYSKKPKSASNRMGPAWLRNDSVLLAGKSDFNKEVVSQQRKPTLQHALDFLPRAGWLEIGNTDVLDFGNLEIGGKHCKVIP